MALTISVGFYIYQCILVKAYGLKKVLSGECLYQIGFMLWLYFFNANTFMHFIPLLLSCVGKLYIMAAQKNG